MTMINLCHHNFPPPEGGFGGARCICPKCTAERTCEAERVAIGDDNLTPMPDGVWYRSAMSGELYRDRTKAGDIDCVYVDGVHFGKLG